MCRGIMSRSGVFYTVEDLRLHKIHAKLLTDAMEVYRDNTNDYLITILENFATCKKRIIICMHWQMNIFLRKIEQKNCFAFRHGLKAAYQLEGFSENSSSVSIKLKSQREFSIVKLRFKKDNHIAIGTIQLYLFRKIR